MSKFSPSLEKKIDVTIENIIIGVDRFVDNYDNYNTKYNVYTDFLSYILNNIKGVSGVSYGEDGNGVFVISADCGTDKKIYMGITLLLYVNDVDYIVNYIYLVDDTDGEIIKEVNVNEYY
jgi:hypothetical protein